MARQTATATSENTGTSRERSNANLHPFQPGQSGNPGGRPKGLAKAVRDVAQEIAGEDGAVLLAKIAWTMVSDTKLRPEQRAVFWRLLAERGWGKPAEFVPIEADDPLELSEQEANEIAADFMARVDEVAQQRAKSRKATSK